MCRVQSLMTALGDEINGKELGLGGDGRYFNKEAAQIIIKLAAGNGFKKARCCIKQQAPSQLTTNFGCRCM